MSQGLILASKSAARATVLKNAGLTFDQLVAGVDEDSIKAGLREEGASPMKQAELLAETKAIKVSRGRPEIVLGADQILDLEGEAFDKPPTLEAARNHLLRLNGKTHTLQTAIVACIEGAPVWRHIAQPRLTMRTITPDFLDDYLATEGEGLLTSVGAYKLEGRGVQLFERIEGDFFSILGLPLLPLLAWLRDRRALPT